MPERRAGDDPDEEERDGDGRTARGCAPPAPGATDGDAGSPAEPRGPQDGIIVVGEPTAARDGIADMSQDARMPEDIAAFTSPPAGYNPYLYQIELDPLTDRRTRELFNIEPYYARGIRVGSFVVFPEAQIGATATNNIFRNSARLADSALEVRRQRARGLGLAQARRRVPRQRPCHLLRPSSPPRTTAPTRSRRAAGSTSRSAPTSRCWPCTRSTRTCARCAILPRTPPSAATWRPTVSRFAFNHRFNRLSLQLRGSITDLEFSPVTSTERRHHQQRRAQHHPARAAFRTSWALSRSADVFAEVGRQRPRVTRCRPTTASCAPRPASATVSA